MYVLGRAGWVGGGGGGVLAAYLQAAMSRVAIIIPHDQVQGLTPNFRQVQDSILIIH